jgi:hypothetical protein
MGLIKYSFIGKEKTVEVMQTVIYSSVPSIKTHISLFSSKNEVNCFFEKSTLFVLETNKARTYISFWSRYRLVYIETETNG